MASQFTAHRPDDDDDFLAGLPLFAGRPPGWSAHLPAPAPGQSSVQPEDLPAGESLDWPLVRQLKRRSVDKVEEEVKGYRQAHGRDPGPDDIRELGKPIIDRVVAAHAASEAADGHLWSRELEDAYIKAVTDAQFGFGRLQPLFEIPTAENINIYGQSVKVRHNDGRSEDLPPVSDSNDELMEQLQQMASNATPRRAFDAANVDMTLMIGDRFRVHAISTEVSPSPSVAIRQHLLTQVSLADLADRNLMPIQVAEFLDAAVLANKTIVVAGEQGAGKTTLLRALIDAIPHQDRFATLETDLELFAHLMPGRENDLVLYSRSGMGERTADGQRAGQIGISAMVDMALRQNLQRIIVGEVRGSEASAMFQAMQTGAGTMSTTHANSAQTTATRLASRVAEGPVYSIEEAMRQVGLCIDLIVFVSLVDDSWNGGTRRRFISDIQACSPGDRGDGPAFMDIYKTDVDGNPGPFTPGAMGTQLSRYRRDLHRYETASRP